MYSDVVLLICLHSSSINLAHETNLNHLEIKTVFFRQIYCILVSDHSNVSSKILMKHVF